MISVKKRVRRIIQQFKEKAVSKDFKDSERKPVRVWRAQSNCRGMSEGLIVSKKMVTRTQHRNGQRSCREQLHFCRRDTFTSDRSMLRMTWRQILQTEASFDQMTWKKSSVDTETLLMFVSGTENLIEVKRITQREGHLKKTSVSSRTGLKNDL